MPLNGSEMFFPNGFLWGAGTSAHQVEGNNINNDWWAWEQEGRVSQRSGLACDHYHRYADDLRLAASLGLNAYRFSVEWSRIEPRPGVYAQAELDHYRNVVATCRSNGLEPLVTLHHFTLPQWLARQGGWLADGVADRFAAYVAQVVAALEVTYWATINEPEVLLVRGYLEGSWPPGDRSLIHAFAAFRAMVEAHQKAVQAIRQIRPQARLGVIQNWIHFEPLRSRHLGDRLICAVHRAAFDHAFLNQTAASCDWIGINYYSRNWSRCSVVHPRQCFMPLPARDGERTTMMGWSVYPPGIRAALHEVAMRYGKPLYVTENGIATTDDRWRIAYIEAHLAQLAQAIHEGVDIRGYFHWSLLDNFEWAEGFRPRFGLVAVDYATQRRTPRPSAYYLGRMATANRWLPAPAMSYSN
ncbi:MAG: glycoside hydrolase family 1 protein [Firmicutes bacterium]|nr:glycoside hydrolase family 1 protein [Bacillota bacterium]